VPSRLDKGKVNSLLETAKAAGRIVPIGRQHGPIPPSPSGSRATRRSSPGPGWLGTHYDYDAIRVSDRDPGSDTDRITRVPRRPRAGDSSEPIAAGGP